MPAAKTARLSLIVTVALVLLVTLLFLFFVDFKEVEAQLRQANTAHLALATLLLLAGFGVYTLRWQFLLRWLPPVGETFHASNLGHLLNMLIPLRPGEAMRVVLMNSNTGAGVGLLTSSVVVERMLETLMRLAAFGGMLIIGIGFSNSPAVIAGLVGFLVIALAVLVWMINNRDKILYHLPRYLGRIPRLSEERAHKILAELLDALAVMSSPRSLAVGLATSALTAGLFFGFHYFTLLAFDFPLTQSQMLSLALGILVISPPSSPGVYHVQLVLPFAAMGIPGSYLASYSIVLYALQSVLIVAFGILALYKTGSSLSELLRRRQPAPVPVEIDISTGD